MPVSFFALGMLLYASVNVIGPVAKTGKRWMVFATWAEIAATCVAFAYLLLQAAS